VSNTLTMNVIAHDHASKTFKAVSQAADESGKSLKDFGERNKETLSVAGAAAGAAGAAVLVKGFSDVLSQEQATANLGAKLGLSKIESAKLGKISGQLYAENYGSSVEDINTTLSQVMQNQTLSAYGNVKDSAAKLLTVTQAYGVDSAAVVNATGQLLANGLVRDATEATDVIAKGFEKGVNKSDDFLDSLNEYGVQFNKLGLSAAEATGLISQGIINGARDSDTVADTLKEFSILASANSKESLAAFSFLGLNGKKMGADIAGGGSKAKAGLQLTLDKLREMKDPVKKLAVAQGLFGTKSEDMGKALLGLNLKNAVSQIGTVAGKTDAMAKAMGDTAPAKFQTFRRKLEQDVASKVQSTVVRMEGLLGVLGKIISFIADHLEVFVALGATIATVVGVIKTVAFVTETWAAAQKLLNLAFLTSPIFWVVAGIALVVVGIIAAYKHFKGFRDVVDAVGRACVIAFKALWSWSKTAFAWIKNNWKYILGFIVGPIGLAIVWITQNWSRVRKVFTDFFSWSSGKWNQFKNFTRSIFMGVVNYISYYVGNIRRVWNSMTSALAGGFDSTVGRVIRSIQRIPDTFSSILNGIRRMWNSTIGGFSFSAPSWIPGIGGQGFNIPFLAQGGIATRPTLAMIGDGGEPEMVLPLSKARQQGFGGSTGMTVNIHVTQPLGSPEAIARAVSTALRSSSVRGNTFAIGRA
jgi:urease gamma subunit